MVYKLLGAAAAVILAFLAGKARQNAEAAAAFNRVRQEYERNVREIAAMDVADVDDELSERLRDR